MHAYAGRHSSLRTLDLSSLPQPFLKTNTALLLFHRKFCAPLIPQYSEGMM